MDGQRQAPIASPPVKTRYPLYRRLGGPQGRPGSAWKISPLKGFDPRIVHPVASHYTNWAIPAGYRSHIRQSITAWTSLLGFPTIQQSLSNLYCQIYNKCINSEQYLVSVCTGVILHLSHQCRTTKALPPLHWSQLLIINVMVSIQLQHPTYHSYDRNR